jgi:hypothetical protein
MSPKTNPIQQQLGQHLIEGVRKFVSSELPKIEDLEKNTFEHIDDAATRSALAQTFYGARWIYKTGLVLLATGPERAAHIRAQIIDYASICESILGEMIIYGQTNRRLEGSTKDFEDFKKARPINWSAIQNVRKSVEKLQFWWRIEVAAESKIIRPKTAGYLRAMKADRNTVHIHRGLGRGKQYFLNDSIFAFQKTIKLIKDTKAWKAAP